MSGNINTSSYFSVSASSSNGMSGLVSGMDTEGMVKKMLSGTQTKIDKLNQEKQRIDWKQTTYRDVISTINNFRSTYMDSSYGSNLKNNLASASFFNTMKSAVTSGSSVKIVSTDNSTLSGDISVKVSQLASAAKLASNVKMSGDQSINGKPMDLAAIKGTLDAGTNLSFDLTLDGVTKAVTLSASDFEGKEINADSVTDALKAEVKQAFGGYVSLDMTDGKLKFSINLADAGHELKITGADASKFGITPGSSSLISGLTKLGELAGVSGESFSFTINGEKLNFTADTTISAMMNTINSSSAGVKLAYSSMTDTFTMEASSTGAKYGIEITQEAGNVLSLIFGESVISAPAGEVAGTLAPGAVEPGTDALIEINGIATSRSSNTFTIDGLTLTATKESDEATVIGTQRDADTIVEGIKSFVKDYNSMMKKLSDHVTQKAEYRKYAPLTDAQREEMSEKQIERWEEKAKTGLVRADPNINQFLDSMKNIVYATPSSAGIGLYSIGINTKAWDQTGQLEIDETVLRNAIATDPDAVRALFTDAEEGITAQMTKACDYTAKVSSASPGTLVSLAGADSWSAGEKNNDLYDELTRINDRLEYLQVKYEAERTRYWNQFSQMETILANYSAQSNLIAQQFNSY